MYRQHAVRWRPWGGGRAAHSRTTVSMQCAPWWLPCFKCECSAPRFAAATTADRRNSFCSELRSPAGCSIVCFSRRLLAQQPGSVSAGGWFKHLMYDTCCNHRYILISRYYDIAFGGHKSWACGGRPMAVVLLANATEAFACGTHGVVVVRLAFSLSLHASHQQA